MESIMLLAPFLDKHLVLLLLEHHHKVHPEADASVKLELLAKTRMVDFAREEHERLGVAVPAALTARRAALIAEHKALAGRTAELRKLLEECPAPTPELLAARGVPAAQAEDLQRLARFQFDAGNYSQAAEYLAACRSLAGGEEAGGLLWGRLAAEILLQDWAGAQERLARLREAADRAEPAALQLTQRAWLLHWALFVCFAQPDGAARFLELALGESMLNALQTACPHLLLYVAVAHVAAPASQRRLPARELARVLEQEAAAFSHPATRFLLALHSEHDFEAALAHLAAAEAAVRQDFFLQGLAATYGEKARALVFRSYCRIHRSLDLALLQEKLGAPSPAAAESYVVNLIRDEQDAKIDSASNQIVFSPAASSAAVYQKIIEKTQALTTQTALLQAQLSRHQKR